MDDLISRQAAIDALDGEIKLKDSDDVDSVARYIQQVARKINEWPSAEKKGKWIIKDNPGTGWYRVTCSECGEDVTSVIPMIGFPPNAKVLWNFCPDCGSDMREGFVYRSQDGLS